MKSKESNFQVRVPLKLPFQYRFVSYLSAQLVLLVQRAQLVLGLVQRVPEALVKDLGGGFLAFLAKNPPQKKSIFLSTSSAVAVSAAYICFIFNCTTRFWTFLAKVGKILDFMKSKVSNFQVRVPLKLPFQHRFVSYLTAQLVFGLFQRKLVKSWIS